jgi:pantothenate kinase
MSVIDNLNVNQFVDFVVTACKRIVEERLKSPGPPLMVAVGGGPGSGKTTLVEIASKVLNERGVKTQCLPMDGFHYPKNELDQMEDPVNARARRGDLRLCVEI